jgi:uncharacterized protein (DUF1800 family)
VSIEAVIAANRFGLGARPGELTQIGSDPRGWLKQQVRGSRTTPPVIAALPSSEKAFEAYSDALRMRRDARQNATKADPAKLVVQGIRRRLGPIHSEQVLARYQWASSTPESFRERLVHFWTNHFAVSAEKPQVLVLAGTLENEAVRPNLGKRFADMLLAVESHPAMIFYLDNQASVGPNSRMAQRAARNTQRKLDINENLAREVLELHTLGVQGGYTQQDVTTFAKILTGWSVNARRFASNGPLGTFAFHAAAHEPGAKTLLGKRYGQEGESQVRAVLNDLARHPATAEHIARKLVCHFIADEPPAAAVTRIAKVFRDSDGSLPQVHAALVDLPEAWSSKASKYKTPHEFVVSAFRAASFMPQNPQQAVGPLQLLGQAPYRPGSPAGWPDTASQWDGPDALLKRVEWSAQLGTNLSARHAPLDLASQALGEVLSERTRTAIARAASAAQGITLWLASPEFLRR